MPADNPALDPLTLHPIPDQRSMAYLEPLVADHPKISAGAYSYVHSFDEPPRFVDQVKYAFDFIDDRLDIGKFCSIAHGATFILNGGNHFSDRLSAYPFPIFGCWGTPDPGPWPNKGGIMIGHDVWIGWDATILPGVSIGNGAIIAAKSVVASDVEPYTIVAGNPARMVKRRLPTDVANRLQALAWWDWPIHKIACASNALMNADITALEQLAEDPPE